MMTPDQYAERAYDALNTSQKFHPVTLEPLLDPTSGPTAAQVNATLAVAAAIDMLRFQIEAWRLGQQPRQ
jgi:hypothetical protein